MRFTITKESLDPKQLVYIRRRHAEGKYKVRKVLYYSFVENQFCYILEPADDSYQDQSEVVAMDNELEAAPNANTIWELQKGDTYYTISSKGEVHADKWQVGDPGKCVIERQLQSIGEIYLTQEDAQMAFDNKKIISQLLKYGARHSFKVHGFNYFIVKDDSQIVRCSLYSDDVPSGHWYFDSKEAIDEAIKNIGATKIYHALFG